MEITCLEEVKKVCRICLEFPEEPISIWDTFLSDRKYNLAQILMECAPINIDKDSPVSQLLCSECVSVLTGLYTFRQRCIKTNTYLVDLVEKVQNLAPEEVEYIETIDIKEEAIIPEYLEEEELEIIPNTSETCDICDCRIADWLTKEDHFYQHVAVATYLDYQYDQISCYACDKDSFKNLNDLEQHLNLHTSYSCRMCKLKFVLLEDLKTHLAEHGLNPIILCYVCFNSHPDSKHNHKLITDKTTFGCSLCPSTFSTCSELKFHIKIHTKSEFNCTLCDKAFNDILQYLKHKRTHKFEKLCSDCGTCFPTKSQLDQHIRSKHSTLQIRAVCSICNKVFSNHNSLKIHIMRHQNYRPYTCTFAGCEYRTLQSIDLKKHERTHTGYRPFKCTFAECELAFKTSSHRAAHLRRHMGEKRHKCSECDMRFTETNQLKAHAMTHTDIRPYSCDICSRSFRRRYYVKRHKDLVHMDGAMRRFTPPASKNLEEDS